MDNELSQLDALIESDVLDALGKTPEETPNDTLLNKDDEFGDIVIENLTEEDKNETSTDEDSALKTSDKIDTQEDDEKSVVEEEKVSAQFDQEISSASLSKLLSELLNNKTIEITIKIKD